MGTTQYRLINKGLTAFESNLPHVRRAINREYGTITRGNSRHTESLNTMPINSDVIQPRLDCLFWYNYLFVPYLEHQFCTYEYSRARVCCLKQQRASNMITDINTSLNFRSFGVSNKSWRFFGPCGDESTKSIQTMLVDRDSLFFFFFLFRKWFQTKENDASIRPLSLFRVVFL